MSSYFPNRLPLGYLNLTKNMITYIRRQQHKNFRHKTKITATVSWCLKKKCFHIFSKVKVIEWPPIGKIAAHSAYDMFHGIIGPPIEKIAAHSAYDMFSWY